MPEKKTYEETLDHANTHSSPTDLKITDMRFAQLEGAPYPCTIMKLYTNQGIVGFGEVRDMASKTYALMLKGRLLGENPCNIDKLFRRVKQFGFHGRQGGGVSAVEIALWDIAGKAYGIPVYQMLGGKFRDKMRIYCDTDVHMHEDRSAGEAMGKALLERMSRGYTMLKMDLGVGLLKDVPGAINRPLRWEENTPEIGRNAGKLMPGDMDHSEAGRKLRKELRQSTDKEDLLMRFAARNAGAHGHFMPHQNHMIQITEKGLDYLEAYVADVRGMIGYEIPLALDHFGPLGVEEIIKLAKRIEKFNIAWMEDPINWIYTDQWKRLVNSTTIPICTGEENYLAESFVPLLEAGGLGYVHPDMLTLGGIFETKMLGNLAQTYGVRMVLHQAATPIHAMAAAHAGVATQNCIASEFHANDVPWWDDIIISKMPKPLVHNGFIDVPDLPGLGIDDLNDEVINQHISASFPGLWENTDNWNFEYSIDKWIN